MYTNDNEIIPKYIGTYIGTCKYLKIMLIFLSQILITSNITAS